MNASASGDMDMDGGNFTGNQQKKQKVLSDFGAMGDMLNKIENKMQKQQSHQERQATGKKEKVSALDRDKERLEKIGGMSAFQDNALDNLFLHINNTVA